MAFFIAINAIGAFVLDEDNKVLYHRVFYPDKEKAISIMTGLVRGETNEDITALVEDLAKEGFKNLITEDQMTARSLSKSSGIEINIEDSAVIKWFRQNQKEYLKELSITKTPTETTDFLREAAVGLAKSRISEAIEERDLLVKNAVDAVDEIDKSINVLIMRLREWYSLHHPALSQIIEDQEQFAGVLGRCCGKGKMTKECLVEAGLSEDEMEKIMNSLGEIGAPLKDSDLTVMQDLARAIGQLYQRRADLEEYVGNLMKEVAPNMSVLAGPLVGARLISTAGSLKELARKPSSTIQVFGAERALFRSIKTGAAPPKHGIIYRVPEINTAPYWIRGKVARALAGKLSIASRIDAYSDKDMGEKLREDFLARVEEIKRQNPDPPKDKKPPQKRQTRGGRRQRKDSRGRRRKGGKKQ
ncbi:C/D box methylation guide ribonucleoprotein complex aNOP56 subunit [Candidatus Thorarchaeota archaeon]|jgi:nucleolar protein 56|nr:MAG: C/D box methylation guide ribonucleoprotein complex aNOP56 subunit [Candidatus Thorarchaeota archaeon]